jgi:aspartate oxidase
VVSNISLDDKLCNFKIESISDISKVLWKYVGIERNEEDLKRAYSILEDIENREKNIYRKRLAKLGKLICKAALERKESRGAHYRVDYPKTNKSYEKHTLVKSNEEIVYIEKNLKDRLIK